MRTLTLVIYDICDDARLRAVFALCKAFGDHLQYSVFCMKLSPVGHIEFVRLLRDIIDSLEDRVLIVRLGPDSSATRSKFETLGRQLVPGEEGPNIF
jgi:CRISPR-associated protein Cas2